MTRAGTIAAARPLDRLFCITRFDAPQGPVPVPVTWEELDRGTIWAGKVLGAHGVEAGGAGMAAIVSKCEDVAWMCPFERALIARGITYMGSDALGFDANRLVAYLRRLPVEVVLSLDAATVEGLTAVAPLEALLREVRLLFARPEAVAPLRTAGLSPRVWAIAGPATAVECVHGGLHIDGDEWQVGVSGGLVTLTSRGERGRVWSDWPLPGFRRAAVPCPCGSTDPQLALCV
jgi:hypothetical protein